MYILALIFSPPLPLQSLISFGWEVAEQPEVKLGHFEIQLHMAGCHISQAWNSLRGGKSTPFSGHLEHRAIAMLI